MWLLMNLRELKQFMVLTATYPRMLIAFARPSGQPQPREAPGSLSGAPQCLTAQFRALCLRVLARQGAAVELAHPRRQFPFALLQLLETPEEASNMVTIPECRKDTWTLAMQKQYPDLRGDDSLGNTNSACAPPKH